MNDIVFDGMVFDRLREIGDQGKRIAELEAEIACLRLTDAEREALEYAVFAYSGTSESVYEAITDTLRGLLARLA